VSNRSITDGLFVMLR